MIGELIGIGTGVAMGAANDAANQQTKYLKQANALQLQMYNDATGRLDPFVQGGSLAMGEVNKLLGLVPGIDMQAALEATPGYQFTKTQGLNAVQNSASARGLGLSGAAMKGAGDFVTGLSDATFNSRFGNALNAATLGENAAAQSGAFGIQTGANMGANFGAIGSAQGAGIVGSANALNTGIGSFSNMLMAMMGIRGMGGGQPGQMSGMYGAGQQPWFMGG